MSRYALDKAAIVLGVAAVVSALFRLVRGEGEPVRLVLVTNTHLAVLLVLGALAVAGGILGGWPGRALAVVAGAGFGAAAVIQLLGSAGGPKLLGGGLTTMALFGGFAIGLLAVALTPRANPQ